MKCNLSKVWQQELTDKPWEGKQALAKKQAEEQQAEIDRLSKLGWQFRAEIFCHPHCGDTWANKTFKSPRMRSFRDYSEDTNFLKEETWFLAFSESAYYISTFRSMLEELLRHYFLDNPVETKSPDFNITINFPNEKQITRKIQTNALPSFSK